MAIVMGFNQDERRRNIVIVGAKINALSHDDLLAEQHNYASEVPQLLHPLHSVDEVLTELRQDLLDHFLRKGGSHLAYNVLALLEAMDEGRMPTDWS